MKSKPNTHLKRGENMTLTIEEVVKTIKAAQEAGYPPMLVINGEYYGIKEQR